MDPQTSDEILMSLILKGNKPAFELLYERYYQKLVWYVQQMVSERTIAEDIVQEVFVKIIETPEKFDLNRTFSTWVYTVATNMSRNHLRHHTFKKDFLKQHVDDPISKATRIHHSIDSKILGKQMQEIFSQLSVKEKSIFTLRFEQQLSIKEISSIMEIPEGSVKSGIFYLLKKYNYLIQHFAYEH